MMGGTMVPARLRSSSVLLVTLAPLVALAAAVASPDWSAALERMERRSIYLAKRSLRLFISPRTCPDAWADVLESKALEQTIFQTTALQFYVLLFVKGGGSLNNPKLQSWPLLSLMPRQGALESLQLRSRQRPHAASFSVEGDDDGGLDSQDESRRAKLRGTLRRWKAAWGFPRDRSEQHTDDTLILFPPFD
ncbi:hypothetical protein HPB50_003131 [Hyalomma asiaticum]|uniref:Uncharacterized protein n=1 Tax=Hyalomma asiaticum TaxID=266040 RepID=A0ACB7SM62_HYAAI|nr:hypothetical protein HPB50_003131 [Hyalomma asiaticum]